MPYGSTTTLKNKLFHHEEHEEHEVFFFNHLFVSFVNFVVKILGCGLRPHCVNDEALLRSWFLHDEDSKLFAASLILRRLKLKRRHVFACCCADNA